MPFCDVSAYQSCGSSNGIKIFYKCYGSGPVKVLLIIGLAGTHDSWGPQIQCLTECSDVEVCAFDNRGVGQSSIPTPKSQYSTTIMAKDAIAVMDHLGWTKTHVFGHSMGGMIACKLAALVPQRISSLALLNVTGGGYECLPKLDRVTLSIAIRFLKAKTPEQRAAVDLDTHYSKDYLEEYVGNQTRREILYQEYVKGISSTGMQSSHGFDGQINACWRHKLTQKEFELICSAGFLISVIHGRHDVIAQLSHAKRLAEKFYPCARMVDLHGGHLVSHERTDEPRGKAGVLKFIWLSMWSLRFLTYEIRKHLGLVNNALLELMEASEHNLSPYEWTNIPPKIVVSAWDFTQMSLSSTSSEGSNLHCRTGIFDKLCIFLMYIFGIFLSAFKYVGGKVRGIIKSGKVVIVPNSTEQELVPISSTGSSLYMMDSQRGSYTSSNGE